MSFDLVYEKTFYYNVHCDHKNENLCLSLIGFKHIIYFAKHNI